MESGPANLPTTEVLPHISDSDMNQEWDEENGDGEEGELSDEVDKFLDSGLDSGDIEDGDDPDWVFKDGETRSSDPAYVFCPAPHHKPLLHLFTKHFCQHPVFPEWNDEARNAPDICKHAVMEMYQFCCQHGL